VVSEGGALGREFVDKNILINAVDYNKDIL